MKFESKIKRLFLMSIKTSIEFVNGVFETENIEIIEALKKAKDVKIINVEVVEEKKTKGKRG